MGNENIFFMANNYLFFNYHNESFLDFDSYVITIELYNVRIICNWR